MDEAFHLPTDSHRSVSHVCSRPGYAEIDCTTTTDTGTDLRGRFIFLVSGMIHELNNVNANVACNNDNWI